MRNLEQPRINEISDKIETQIETRRCQSCTHAIKSGAKTPKEKKHAADMLKRLDKLRMKDHPGYVKLMGKLGKEKNKKMSSSQKDLLRVVLDTESVTREKKLAYQDGYMLMSDSDYYVHMQLRTGWSRRKIQRDFEVKLAIKTPI